MKCHKLPAPLLLFLLALCMIKLCYTYESSTIYGETYRNCSHICNNHQNFAENDLDCVEECNGLALLNNGTCSIIARTIEPHSPATCPPEKSTVRTRSISVKLSSTGKVVSYLLLTWLPCGAGIEDLKGYIVTIRAGYSMKEDCYNLTIPCQLTLNDREMQMSFLVKDELQYNKNYKIVIIPFPIVKQNFDEYKGEFHSPSCESLNGDWSCLCVNDISQPYHAPTVIVKGYAVEVRVPLANECFNVGEYHFYLYQIKQGAKTRIGRRPIVIHLKERVPVKSAVNETYISYVFHDIYNAAPTKEFSARVLLYLSHGTVRGSRFAYSKWLDFNVTAWIPPQPTVKPLESDPHIVEVLFPVAGNEYGIEKYEMRVIGRDTSYNVSKILPKPTGGQGVVKWLWNLTVGIYTVKIREVRSPEVLSRRAEAFAAETSWNETQILIPNPTIVPAKEKSLPDWLWKVLAIVISLTAVIIFVVAFFFLWQKGQCKKVGSHLPESVSYWIDFQTRDVTNVKFRSRSVLLVWQSDMRSPELNERHAENIRHLASYLTSVCGLEVLLDLFDHIEVNVAISLWVEEACKKAEFILFVYPHYDYAKALSEQEVLRPDVGDFERFYKFLESEIGRGNRKKFVTVMLPYSDLKSFRSSRYLTNMTSTFKLMDQIADLYFHIQGYTKSTWAGKRIVENVNKEDYMKTDEGKALYVGIQAFQPLTSTYVSNTVLEQGYKSNNTNQVLNVQKFSSRNKMEEIQPVVGSASDFRRLSEAASLMRNNKESKVVINRIDGAPPPLLCSSALNRQRFNVTAPPPLVIDPEKEILLINKEGSATYPDLADDADTGDDDGIDSETSAESDPNYQQVKNLCAQVHPDAAASVSTYVPSSCNMQEMGHVGVLNSTEVVPSIRDNEVTSHDSGFLSTLV